MSAASVGMGAALSLPAMLLAAFGKGTYDYFHTRSTVLAGATLGEGASIEELQANLAKQQQLLADAQAYYKQVEDAELWASLAGIPTEGKLSEATAQLDAQQAAVKAAQQQLDEALANADASAESTLGALPGDAQAWGADMMTSMADGVTAGANSSLIPTITSVAAAIAALLHHSEPDVGPLANDSEWMPDMMESFAAGIRDNRGLVLDEMNALASDMAGSMSGGGGTTMNYGGVTVVFQVQDGQDGRALFEEFSDWLAQGVYREGATFA